VDLSPVKSVVSKIPKKTLIVSVVSVVLLVGAFLAGRYTTPVKVQEKVVEKVVVQEKIVTVEVDKKNTDEDQKKDTHTVVVVVKKKDGSTITTETKDTHADDQKHEVEIKYVDRVVNRVVEKEVTVTKTIDRILPQWSVTAKVGTTFNQLKPSLAPPYFQPLLVGVDVDRRILGPIWFGMWGLTDLKLNAISAGVAVKLEF
jgi:hypothetical protein